MDTIKNPDIPSTAFACISGETLANLLKSMTQEQFSERFIIIDCRYPFEFVGGHIRVILSFFNISLFFVTRLMLKSQIQASGVSTNAADVIWWGIGIERLKFTPVLHIGWSFFFVFVLLNLGAQYVHVKADFSSKYL